MSTRVYGQIYGYFLEVCRRYIDSLCHNEYGLPRNGTDMYNYLNQNSVEWYDMRYEDIVKAKRFPIYIERILLPENGTIEVNKLDARMYFKIIEILEGSIRKRTHMDFVRNYLCHVPMKVLQRPMAVDDFRGIMQLMRHNFEAYGICRELLREIEEYIFHPVFR